MKISRVIVGVMTLATLAGVGVSSMGAVAVSADDKATLQAKNTTLLDQIQSANAKVAELSGKVSNKVLAIADAEKEITTAGQKVAAYNTAIAQAKTEVQKRKGELKSQLVSLQKQAGDSVTGNVYVDFLLNSKDISDLVSRSFTVNKLSQASGQALDAVNEAKNKVTSLKANQEAKQKQLEATKAQLVADKKQVESLKGDAQTAATKLQKQLDDNKDQLAAIAASETAAAAAVETARQQAAASSVSTSTQDTASNASHQASNNASSSNGSSSSSSANSNGNNGASSGSSTGTPSVSGGSIASNAAKYIGVPYVYGGSTPAGFDCSGLIWYAAKEAGISLPRTSQAMSTLGSYVSVGALQAGDLVFWGGVGSAYHVGVYVGGGNILHAPAPGQNVKIQSMSYFMPSFGRRL